jgi:hypothetical protein
MQQSPKLIVGFDCDQSALASSPKPQHGPVKKGLLKCLLSGQGSCLYSDETHYSDEYETDDEFFEGSDLADSDEHQLSSESACCSSSPASGSLSRSSEPIDIPYKR